MHVCVIGLGYVGLPTALKLAEAGHSVIGVDLNELHVENLKNGMFESSEEGMNELYLLSRQCGNVKYSTHVSPADVYIICVPTPVDQQGNADLTAVVDASVGIKPYIKPSSLVVVESTVPPGTTGMIAGLIGEARALYAHVPERVLPGRLLWELVYNDRIVGGLTHEAGQVAAHLYKSFVRGQIVLTNVMVAEMSKLMENTYRDVNIALANEFTRICHFLGISAHEVIRVANNHPRVNILTPGPGVGGHCIAVDPWFIVQKAPQLSQLIRRARMINDEQPMYVADFVQNLMGGDLNGKLCGILGLAYKGNVSDTRESPSITLAQLLSKRGANVVVHDPYATVHTEWPNVTLDYIMAEAEVLVVATDHQQYATLPRELLVSLKRHALVLDTRGILNQDDWLATGHRVHVLGDETHFDGQPVRKAVEV